MYTVLLRAYFDLFGNFENIINVPFYDILNKSAKQKSLTVEEFCYQEIGYEADDLYQIACIGFIEAIQRFDFNYDVELSTYSVQYMIGEIKKFI